MLWQVMSSRGFGQKNSQVTKSITFENFKTAYENAFKPRGIRVQKAPFETCTFVSLSLFRLKLSFLA
jgi:hypothetical protein